MTHAIRLLDDNTINKIAAGEVIESPASVVKELVENALDAGSTQITIEIQGGGRQLIRISDDGVGMGRDDALLCIERHATSKIRSIEDLLCVGSMGFRGEALASIASVSKCTVITKPADGSEGTLLSIEAGAIRSCTSAERDPGTTIEVKQLFFNVPARRKFQKSPQIEQTRITQLVTRLALSNPSVGFQLIVNGQSVLRSLPLNDKDPISCLSQRASDLLGSDFCSKTEAVTCTEGKLSLTALVGKPELSRPQRSGQHLLVNGRAISSVYLSRLIQQAFGHALPEGRHPIGIFAFTLPHDMVDVNVHPQKLEVRIRDTDQLQSLVYKTIQKSLTSRRVPTPKISLKETAAPYIPVATPVAIQEPTSVPAPTAVPVEEQSLPFTPLQQEWTLIDRLSGYLLVRADEGSGPLMAIDQRRAHGRVLYDQITGIQQRTVATQRLLLPHTVSLDAANEERLLPLIPLLEKIGIPIRSIGPGQYGIDELPAWMELGGIDSILEALLKERGSVKHASDEVSRGWICNVVASRAVSRNRRMSEQEARHLLKDLSSSSDPLRAPSGEPIMAEVSPSLIGSLF